LQHLSFYVGLSRMVIDSDVESYRNMTIPSYIEYGSEACDAGYCNDCENAATNIISSVIVAFITCKFESLFVIKSSSVN